LNVEANTREEMEQIKASVLELMNLQ